MTTKAKATAAPALKLLVGVGVIEKELKALFTIGQSYQSRLHIAACSVLQHVGKHSDVRLVDGLLASMPEASRKTAMMKWLNKFGPIDFDKDEKATFVKGGKTLLGDAMATPFWKLTPDQTYEPLVIAKFIASMVKKLNHDTKKTNVDHSAMVTALNKLVPANKLAA